MLIFCVSYNGILIVFEVIHVRKNQTNWKERL